MSGNSGCDGRSVGRKDYSSIDNNNKHNGLTMKSTIYTTIGASNHSDTTREEHDFYATFPEAIDRLFEVEKFPDTIWEPACGMGHLSKRMIELGKEVYSTDLMNRGYGTGGVDFLKATENPYGAVITNPPYKIALEFIEKALDISDEGTKDSHVPEADIPGGKKT